MSGTHIFVGDCIPDDEVSPATIPQRHVAGDRFLQRHVAGERPDISLGKDPIVVVIPLDATFNTIPHSDLISAVIA
ncbi:hypothetical protein Tco_0208707 [Tanacetum coccineum]